MDLTSYVETLRGGSAAAAEGVGDEARRSVERLTAPLEPATRPTPLDVLSAAMGEITRELAHGSAGVRPRGLEPDFVVVMPRREGRSERLGAPAPVRAPIRADADAGGIVRVRAPGPCAMR
ncbi:hypothetical protein ACYCCF_14160 [Streptomyces argenteolus]